MLQMLGVFAEFEREMIVARANAGLSRGRQNGTKSGKAIGRPRGAAYKPEKIRAALLKGATVREVARSTDASVGTTAAIRKELAAAGGL